jgi:putative transcriptional regulator
VVLVTQPREGPPWGVIINRPLDHLLSEVLSDQPALKGRKDVLYFGGPVMRQALVFLARGSKPPENATVVLRDVYFTSDIDHIEGLLKRSQPTRGLRVYAGYAAWGPGQLQSEMARGSWHVVPADAKTIFEADAGRIWPELIRRAEGKRASAAGTNLKSVSREW